MLLISITKASSIGQNAAQYLNVGQNAAGIAPPIRALPNEPAMQPIQTTTVTKDEKHGTRE